MDTDSIVALIFILCVLLFLIYTPIFKPWFGFRKPKGHKGKWWE